MKARWLAYVTALILLSGTWLYSQSIPTISSGGGTGGLTDTELRATAVPVSATDLDIQSGGADVATESTLSTLNTKFTTGTVIGDVNLGATDNAVLDSIADGIPQDAGNLHANSPIVEVAVLSLFDGSAETAITTISFGTEKTFAPTGSGRLVKLCAISSLGSIVAQDADFYFFDADPNITIDDLDLSLAQSQTVVAVVEFDSANWTSFAASAIQCQIIDEPFHSITFAAFFNKGATTFDDEDMEIHVWYKRDS